MPETLTPDQVAERFGSMFSDRLVTLVDERTSRVRIIEMCTAQGPVEWDAVNRMRAGGVIDRVEVHGNWLIMDARVGRGKVRFGPVSKDTGGQALEEVAVRDGIVETSWRGLAGASIGVGACLPQAKGVLKAEYDKLSELGGDAETRVRIFTPVMRQLVIGIDDTDSSEKGATWALGLRLAKELPETVFLQHKIVQLNHHAPHKTTNCTATAVSFAVAPEKVRESIGRAVEFVRSGSYSDQTAMAFWVGLEMPEEALVFGLRAKETILTIEEASEAAERSDVELIEVTGPRGKIGALAAVGCFDLGLLSAGLPEDFSEPRREESVKRGRRGDR